MSRFIDLSAPIVASPPETPEPLRTDIVFQEHEAGAAASSLVPFPSALAKRGSCE